MREPDAEYPSREDRDLLRDSVREAGLRALEYFGKSPKHWTKEDKTPISEADLAVNDLLQGRLSGQRTGYGWLSEETTDNDQRLDLAKVWVVDPIDGTRSFIKGTPHWTVSVALVDQGRPVLAAVFNPVKDEFFEAIRGGGAWLNGVQVAVSDRADVAGCEMVANTGAFNGDRWGTPWPEMKVTSRNSMAYRLCLVASGNYDATLAISRKHDWDLAAAHLVVEEAGGHVTLHDGGPIVYNQPNPRHGTVLAAGPVLHKALLEQTRTYRGQ